MFLSFFHLWSMIMQQDTCSLSSSKFHCKYCRRYIIPNPCTPQEAELHTQFLLLVMMMLVTRAVSNSNSDEFATPLPLDRSVFEFALLVDLLIISQASFFLPHHLQSCSLVKSSHWTTVLLLRCCVEGPRKPSHCCRQLPLSSRTSLTQRHHALARHITKRLYLIDRANYLV